MAAKRGRWLIGLAVVLSSAVALRAGVSHEEVAGLDLRRFVGPFLRCRDVLLPRWQLVLDVPDVTFRVTQDVDGDGFAELFVPTYDDNRVHVYSFRPPATGASVPAARSATAFRSTGRISALIGCAVRR